MSQMLLILGAAIFVGSMIYTFVAINKSVANSDNKSEMQSAINTVLTVNIIMTLVLGFIAVSYISANPTAERPYTLIMIHLSLLLSIVSVSVSVLQKLDLSASGTVSRT